MERPDPNSNFVQRMHGPRIAERDIDEMVGVCKGLLADGTVDEVEARFLLDWMERHRGTVNTWPGNALYARLQEIFRDGRMDGEEEGQLLQFLMDITGDAQPGDFFGKTIADLSSRLPLTDPVPPVVPEFKYFCLTGKFLTGGRQLCEDLTRSGRAVPQSSVTLQTNFLVIGVMASPAWQHTSYGRKIERAVELRDGGHPIAIIDEQTWAKALGL